MNRPWSVESTKDQGTFHTVIGQFRVEAPTPGDQEVQQTDFGFPACHTHGNHNERYLQRRTAAEHSTTRCCA
jgi:hypothetical protein